MTTHGDMEVDHLDSNDDAIPDGYYREVINHSDWIVPKRYSDLQTVGAGAYGSVCSSKDTQMEMVLCSCCLIFIDYSQDQRDFKFQAFSGIEVENSAT